ncbi:MAG: hypothetical protein OXI57_00300 [Rhodospirillales bacterium]|nr:hypothetical protein [Rhodospirillales bacterium]
MAPSSSITIMGDGIGTRGTINVNGMFGGVIKGSGTYTPSGTSIANGTVSEFICKPGTCIRRSTGIATCKASRFASRRGMRIHSAAITVTTTTGSGRALTF